MSRFRRRCGAFLLVTLFVSSSVQAQNRDAAVVRLVALTNALGGPFGDEGADVSRATRELELSLAQWDVSIARAEQGFAADFPTASPDAAAQMLAAIGALYLQRGRAGDGIRQLTAAMALPSTQSRSTVVQLLAAALRAAGRSEDAEQAIRREWLRHPRDPVLAALAAETKAITSEERAVALDTVMGAALAADGTTGSSAPFVSLGLMDSAAFTEPVFPPARYASAYALFAAGDLDGGLRAVREALVLDPLIADAAVQPPAMWAGIAALRQGRLAEAIEQLRSAANTAPRSTEAHRVLGTAYSADGRLSDARVEFMAALDVDPLNERAYLALADVIRESGDDALAQETVRRAATVIPQSGQLHWALGRISERNHADADAIAEYERATRSGSPIAGEGLIHAAVGRLHHTHLDLDAAASAYEQRVRREPNSAAAHQALGEVLQARDLHESAAIELLVAHLLNPSEAGALAGAAQSLLALARDGDAERAARRAVQIDGDNVQARFTLAGVLPRLGRAEEAQQQLEVYRRLQARLVASQRRGMELNGFKLQAQVLSQAGDHAGAAAAWQQAIALEGPTGETALQLARELAAAGQTDAAVAAYADALARRPDPATQRELVALLETNGRTVAAAAAREAYERMKRERLLQLGAVR